MHFTPFFMVRIAVTIVLRVFLKIIFTVEHNERFYCQIVKPRTTTGISVARKPFQSGTVSWTICSRWFFSVFVITSVLQS